MIDPAFWSGRRVLLTGHTGFKGGWLALWLRAMGAEVYGFALPPSTRPALYYIARVDEAVDGALGDLRDQAAVTAAVRAARPEIVLHLAARALVRACIADPCDAFASNVMGTAHLLDALRGSDAATVLVITSDKVYANDESGAAFDERTPLGGKDPYSASKAATEMVVRAFRETYFRQAGVRVATARGGNVIGGGDYAEDRIVPDIVRAVVAGQKPVIRMPGAVRPWQHALDCLAGYLLYAQALHRRDDVADALNLGPEPTAPVTVGDLTKALLAALGASPDFIHEPVPNSIEMRTLSLNSVLARRTLGWCDLLPGRAAIDWTAAWYGAIAAGADPHARTLAQIEDYSRLLPRH